MKKSEFKKAIAGMFNEVRFVSGVTIARVCWKDKPWMIVERDTDFDTCASPKFLPIACFRNGDELYDFCQTMLAKTI